MSAAAEPGDGRLTLSQSASPSLLDRAVRATVGNPLRRNRPETGARDNAKKAGIIQKTAFFGPSNRFTSARQGCRPRRTERQKGNEDGGNTMLRIRTGARHGLRWSVFGFVAAVLTISSDRMEAAPYSDIVVDANSGSG